MFWSWGFFDRCIIDVLFYVFFGNVKMLVEMFVYSCRVVVFGLKKFGWMFCKNL